MASDTRLRTLPKRTLLSGEEEARLESEDRRAFLRRAPRWLAACSRAARRSPPAGAAGGSARRGRRWAGRSRRAITACPRSSRRTSRRRRTDVFVNRQNWSDWSMTPLQHQYGIVTPNGLIYERHHAGTPDIDPADAPARDPRHGAAAARVLDGRPDALPGGLALLLPRVLGQRPHRLAQARLDDRAADARPARRARSGPAIPVSWLLDEAGVQPGREVGRRSRAPTARTTRARCRSIRCWTTACIVYASNGEMLRPENGYPLRAARSRAGKATSRSSGCAASRSAISRGTSAARRRATPIRCPTASGGSSASRWSASR